jgi:hypothetical protein
VTDHPSIRSEAAAEQELENYRSTVEAQDKKIRRLKMALRGMVDAHTEGCDDGSGMICAACAIAISELNAHRKAEVTP